MSLMYREIKQIPAVTEQQLAEYQVLMPNIAAKIRAYQPKFIFTVGRGSSDHAATFAKYIFATKLGLVTAASAPSIHTLYETDLQLSGALVLAFSQSGQSRDICAVLSAARAAGALTIACVNDIDSPLAQQAELVIPQFAGTESAVAATKSYVASLVAVVSLVAHWQQDQELLAALPQLPKKLIAAQHMDWHLLSDELATRNSAMVLGRGYTFPIALEAALKLKETCKIHAEAFSSAEVLHGPFALMKQNFPLLVFTPSDQAIKGLDQLLTKLTRIATKPFITSPEQHPTINNLTAYANLLLPESLHPVCDPIITMPAFYLAVEACAKQRNIDPDNPENLSKVTDTL